jgi:hypothetical protein
MLYAFLYTLIDFFQSHQTVPKPLLSYLLPYSRRSIALVKRLAGCSKRAEIDLPAHANKVTQGAYRILIYID